MFLPTRRFLFVILITSLFSCVHSFDQNDAQENSGGALPMSSLLTGGDIRKRYQNILI